jgi:hypothetical protein
MESDDVKQALQVIKKYIPNNARFEQNISESMVINNIPRTISGCIDAINAHDGTLYIWEFKCVLALQQEHILQLLIYMWMFTKKQEENIPVRFFLMNILTDTVVEIIKPYNLEEIIKKLLLEKIKVRHKTTDVEFINDMMQISGR